MRKLSLAMMGIATAALMTMVSCRKPNSGNIPGAPRTVTFTATTESNDGSKTAVSDHDILWKTGDAISINGVTFTLDPNADGQTSGTFTGFISSGTPYYVGYPAATTKYTASPLTFSVGIPSSWTYDANNVVVPMAAYSTTENLSFKNAVNVLKLNLNGNNTNASKLTWIVLSNAEANLNGDIAVTINDGDPTFGYADGTKTTTVYFSGEGLQLTSTTTPVYIVLPKIADGDIKITFFCANGKCMEKTVPYKKEFNTVNNLISNSDVLMVSAADAPTFLPGDFSVSTTDKVKFSKGNLQFQTTQKTWRFAENQWDMCDKNEAEHTTSDYAENTDKWIDLFGWGTSGWDNRNTYYQPYNTDHIKDNVIGYGYGPTDGEGGYIYSLTGDYANADWGVYNAVNAGGSATTGWRTLTNAEWGYLINTRTGASGKWALGTVGGCTPGLIILPDEWTSCPEGCSFSSGVTDYTTNVYTYTQWHDMEVAGAVFLPAAGYRGGTSVNYVGSVGSYWSSSCNYSNSACNLGFRSDNGAQQSYYARYVGFSVRLVR